MTKLMRLGRSSLLIIAGLLVGALTLGTTYAISSGPSTTPVKPRKTGFVRVRWITGVVLRSHPASGASQRIGTAVATGTTGFTRVVARILDGRRIIHNDRWLYGVGFCAEDGMTIRGARAVYTR